MGEAENGIALALIEKARKIIGDTAITIAKFEGISIEGGKVVCKKEDYLDSLLKAYSKILGPVANTFGISAALDFFSKPENASKFGKGELASLPHWARPSVSGTLANFFEEF